jgi:hypothetical protein
MSTRSGGDTLRGRQAYSILTWTYEDPRGRMAEAKSRIAELARAATGREEDEVIDAGTMLSRLEGTLAVPEPPEPQVSEPKQESTFATISAQVVDLVGGHHVAGTPYRYRHGFIPIGQQAATAAAQPAVQSRMLQAQVRQLQARQRRMTQVPETIARMRAANARTISAQAAAAKPAADTDAAKAAVAAAMPKITPPPVPPEVAKAATAVVSPSAVPKVPQTFEQIAVARAQVEAAKVRGELRAEHAKAVQDMLDRTHKIQASLEQHKTDVKTDEQKSANMKLATEAAVAIAGAALAAGMALLGVPVLVAILAALGPTATQLIIEWKKHL